MRTAFLILLLLATAARAEDGEPSTTPTGNAVEGDRSEAVADMRKQLEGDEGLQEALIDRIMQSKIAPAISGESDLKKRREECW